MKRTVSDGDRAKHLYRVLREAFNYCDNKEAERIIKNIVQRESDLRKQYAELVDAAQRLINSAIDYEDGERGTRVLTRHFNTLKALLPKDGE